MQEKIKKLLIDAGASDVGFSHVDDGPFGENSFAVSVVVHLSRAVINEIDGAPTHSYFHHYRTVNSFIDSLTLRVGLMLDREGYSYLPIPASQSINLDGWNYRGRYSHKKCAVEAGLGAIGKSSLFLHRVYGPAVRLGTVFTDCKFDLPEIKKYVPLCVECDKCVRACPAGAISGRMWEPGMEREELFDPEKCSNHMKKAYKHIGRGAVCGICMSVCPLLR